MAEKRNLGGGATREIEPRSEPPVWAGARAVLVLAAMSVPGPCALTADLEAISALEAVGVARSPARDPKSG